MPPRAASMPQSSFNASSAQVEMFLLSFFLRQNQYFHANETATFQGWTLRNASERFLIIAGIFYHALAPAWTYSLKICFFAAVKL